MKKRSWRRRKKRKRKRLTHKINEQENTLTEIIIKDL
jgi:hypothetical protein